MAFLVILSGCVAPAGARTSASSAAGGLSRDEAIAAARRAFDFDDVLDATSGPIGRFEPGAAAAPSDHQVWAIVVSGRFQGSCGPWPGPQATPRPCPSPATTATVIVDLETGDFIVASFGGGP
jgi:hypothetical protein